MFARSRWTRLALAAGLMAIVACSEDDAVTVIPAGAAVLNADITANRTLFAETTYTLRGFVHVTNGATLTIMPGTKIVGDTQTVPTTARGAALFIMRGARISAVGTPVSPIVFTSIMAPGSRKPGDWGGLVIIGNGIINRTCPVNVEGTGTIADTVSGQNYFVSYCGGNNNADNSGELRYVRVEYAGFAPVTDQELNAFTFAGVGSGTKLSYLQSMAGLDDAFEWFGGAVDADHIVAYEPLDDGFDMSEGYVGRIQHAIYLKSTVLTARAGAGAAATDPQGVENDGCNGTGCASAFNSTPFTTPVLANFTLIGTNSTTTSGTSGGYGMVLRRGTGGYYVNGLIARFPRGVFGVRDADTYVRAGSTTTPSLTTADLAIKNVTMLESPAVVFQAGQQPAFDLAGNAIVSSPSTLASVFTAFPATISTTTVAGDFDWTPVAASAPTAAGLATFTGKLSTATTAASATGNVVAGSAYTGAAAPGGTKWWAGWTIYAQQ